MMVMFLMRLATNNGVHHMYKHAPCVQVPYTIGSKVWFEDWRDAMVISDIEYEIGESISLILTDPNATLDGDGYEMVGDATIEELERQGWESR